MDGALAGQPARYLEQVESTVRRVRAHLEREDRRGVHIDKLGGDEWLVLDGLLSRIPPSVARHRRALGVIKESPALSF